MPNVTAERARLLWIAAWLGCALGCGDGGAGRGPGTAQEGRSTVGGAVVSTVDGHPITVDDVVALQRASSLSAREALDRLQAEQLLMAEAERRGVSGSDVELVRVRAAVQALLDAEAGKLQVSEREVREAYEKDPRFHVPEKRTSLHVLARANDKATPEQAEAARAVALKAIEDLRTLDWAAVKARYAGKIDGVEVKCEELPPVARASGFVKEYESALYSVSEPSVVAEPVRTRFGWHAVKVTAIAPAHETPFEEAEPALREELATKKRADHVEALLTDLRHANPVTVAPDVNDKLMLVDGADTFRSR